MTRPDPTTAQGMLAIAAALEDLRRYSDIMAEDVEGPVDAAIEALRLAAPVVAADEARTLEHGSRYGEWRITQEMFDAPFRIRCLEGLHPHPSLGNRRFYSIEQCWAAIDAHEQEQRQEQREQGGEAA